MGQVAENLIYEHVIDGSRTNVRHVTHGAVHKQLIQFPHASDATPYRILSLGAGALYNPGAVSIMITENIKLSDRVRALEEQVARLRTELDSEPHAVRDISDEAAKAEVKKLFIERHGSTLYPDDLAEELGIDLMQAVRVCEALAKEGKIARQD